MKPWEEFTRLHTDKPFYGCVAKDGTWFDSSELFDTACQWCAHAVGAFNQEDYAVWMGDNGPKLGLSIIHSTMLRKMYEAGLIK